MGSTKVGSMVLLLHLFVFLEWKEGMLRRVVDALWECSQEDNRLADALRRFNLCIIIMVSPKFRRKVEIVQKINHAPSANGLFRQRGAQ